MAKQHKGFIGTTAGRNDMMGRFKEQLQREFDTKQRFQTDFLLQVGCDAFLMAASDVFQCGPGRAQKAVTAYHDYVMQIMDAVIEHGGDRRGRGENLDYLWTDIDRRLAQITGPTNFTPHDQRYDETGLKLFAELFLRTVRGMKFGNPEDVPEGATAAKLRTEADGA